MKNYIIDLMLKALKGVLNDNLIKEFKKKAVEWAEKQVEKTDNEIDDFIVEILKKVLNVE